MKGSRGKGEMSRFGISQKTEIYIKIKHNFIFHFIRHHL